MNDLEGKKSKGFCFHCNTITSTTFMYRDTPLNNHTINILVGVCDVCNNIISIPTQSTPSIKKELENKRG